MNRCTQIALCFLALTLPSHGRQQSPPIRNKRIVIAAGNLLDGRGNVIKNTRVVIVGSKIVEIDPKAGPVDYDLRELTVLPGWIDSHVHIGSSFPGDEKNQSEVYRGASNAWMTLMAGFTTVQSVGSPADVPLRDAIARGALPGPRVLTSVEWLMGQGEKTGSPEEIR